MNKEILEILLKDQTTRENIMWANSERGKEQIQPAQVDLIKPRHEKIREHQKMRTRDRAEIFTPPEICKLQNDLIEPQKKPWEGYIDAKVLEITCGEAPYLVNRYNAVTGEPIPIDDRFGLLDRKLRVIKKNATAPVDWEGLTRRAVQSVYGYDFQGDNLFLARKNVFETVEEFLAGKIPSKELKIFLIEVAEIISWNLWQMDGLKNTIPYANTNPQGSLFGETSQPRGEIFCQIMNWQSREVVKFKDIVERVATMKKQR